MLYLRILCISIYIYLNEGWYIFLYIFFIYHIITVMMAKTSPYMFWKIDELGICGCLERVYIFLC